MDYKRKGATFGSADYRYSLERHWDDDKPKLGVLMLNPSTADGTTDDPTIRKVVGFADRLGYGGIHVCNLFAFRATNPKDLFKRYASQGYLAAVGPGNNDAICEMRRVCDRVLLGYGAHEWRGIVETRASFVVEQLVGQKAFTLGLTKGGKPRHPLYLPYSATETV